MLGLRSIRGIFRGLPRSCYTTSVSRHYTMERLNFPPPLMLVSDLDMTMVDHDDPDNSSLLKFNSLWEANYRHDSLLIFSTGRSPPSYKNLRKEKPLLTPDITVMSVGAEIAYGEDLVVDDEWEKILNHKWNRDVVIEETSKFPELVPQPERAQRPLKVSFFIDKSKASQVINNLKERLNQRGLDIKIIYSSGLALDVLPRRAGKGEALSYLKKKFEACGKIPVNTLVCGDSGNDAELFTVPGVHSVMVKNAQEELLEWYAQHSKNGYSIFHANERCSSGIMQAISHFGLGTQMTPRDIPDFLHYGTTSPSFEVVKFYVLYEKWRRGDIEKCEGLLDALKSQFHPSGIFVNPYGIEKPLHTCLDELDTAYSDKQGQMFSVWVDQVSFIPVGSDTWQVKFDKWESTDNTHRCRLTKVLLTQKEPEGFTWMHVQQSWKNGLIVEDEGDWIM